MKFRVWNSKYFFQIFETKIIFHVNISIGFLFFFLISIKNFNQISKGSLLYRNDNIINKNFSIT